MCRRCIFAVKSPILGLKRWISSIRITYSEIETLPMPVEIESPSAVDDIFLHDTLLPHRATFFPLGFPLELATNSEAVIAAARQSWGIFGAAHEEPPLSLCLTVTEHDDERLPARPKFRSHGHLMSIVSDAWNQVMCDFSRGCAYGWVTRRVAEDAEFLRLRFLEAPAMSMLVEAYLAPIHAALVAREGRGALLCGDSRAGKSSLAYACARSGWTFVSDDGTFLVRNGAGRYGVGNPYNMRLREDAKSLFPELENCRVGPRPNGQHAMELQTRELAFSTAEGCPIDHVVFLRRGRSGRARINRFEASEALAWLERAAFYGRADVQASRGQAYRRLLDAGIWELHYSNLPDAVELLDQL